jgi:hypothetical protein
VTVETDLGAEKSGESHEDWDGCGFCLDDQTSKIVDRLGGIEQYFNNCCSGASSRNPARTCEASTASSYSEMIAVCS